MPYFEAVGYIDDYLSPDEIKREYMHRWQLTKYHANRALVIKLLGSTCCRCGSSENLKVTRRPNAPAFQVSRLMFLSRQSLEPYLNHLILFCAKDAATLSSKYGQITHGKWYAAYKWKCDCDDCEEYRLNYSLERRENRREAKLAVRPAAA